MGRASWIATVAALELSSLAACGSTTSGGEPDGATSGGGHGSGASSNAGTPAGGGLGGDLPSGGSTSSLDELTCEAAARSYGSLGCDFWPTFVANPVLEQFSAGISLFNEQPVHADVTVDGPNGFHAVLSLGPREGKTVELPWVSELKGPEWSPFDMSGGRIHESRLVARAAYHVSSTVPVALWQLSPLQAEQTGDACPLGSSSCGADSADATALLPRASLTGNYRVVSYAGPYDGTVPGGIAITATTDDTQLAIQAGPRCGTERAGTSALGPCTLGGDGLSALSSSGVLQLRLDAGDVVQLLGASAEASGLRNADLSGSIVAASQPVQVVSFNSLAIVPDSSISSADHVEELLPPAETLGTTYVLAPPSGALGTTAGHVVRLVGNVDGTRLSYPAGKPRGAPDTLDAGEVVHLPPPPSGQPAAACSSLPDHCLLSEPFVIEGSEPFGVASYVPGAPLPAPGTGASQSSPGQSAVVPTAQLAQSFAFFSPEGYSRVYVDLLAPSDATLTLDGDALRDALTPIGESGWATLRIAAPAGGWHLVATETAGGVHGQVSAFSPGASLYYSGGARALQLGDPPVIVP